MKTKQKNHFCKLKPTAEINKEVQDGRGKEEGHCPVSRSCEEHTAPAREAQRYTGSSPDTKARDFQVAESPTAHDK